MSLPLASQNSTNDRFGDIAVVTFMVVQALDGREAIIPNEMLITTTVLNHSYTNRQAQLAIQVQVSYTNLQLVRIAIGSLERKVSAESWESRECEFRSPGNSKVIAIVRSYE